MPDTVELTWFNNHQRIHFNLGTHTRFLDCPNKRIKQIGKHKYFFDNQTCAITSVKMLDLHNKQRTDYEVAKRIWDSFWIEGWRGN